MENGNTEPGEREPVGGAQPFDDGQGGDPVCWLERVCTECGALRDPGEAGDAQPCWRCGAP